jgi:hypothetical protein
MKWAENVAGGGARSFKIPAYRPLTIRWHAPADSAPVGQVREACSLSEKLFLPAQ